MREEGRGQREEGRGKLWLVLAAVALAAMVVVLAGRGVHDAHDSSDRFAAASPVKMQPRSVERTASAGGAVPGTPQLQKADVSPGDGSKPESAPQAAEESRETEEEKLVNEFDDLVDKWMKPSAKDVTIADIDNFAKSFRKIPKTRQDECIHRALNLIPDGNVMLLAGLLMDKTIGKEVVEAVFTDVLNRDEAVKKPILQQIFKDKSHPCWEDVAWILDVTGELPKAK